MFASIVKNFPFVSIRYLETGEGDMLISDKQTVAIQSNNVQSFVNSSDLVMKVMNELSEQRKIVQKQQLQMDDLIKTNQKLTDYIIQIRP